MIGSSGPAETKVYQDAAAAYKAKTGTTVEIIAAQNLVQQLGQGFAGGNPPDVFYVDPTKFQEYAKAGALYPYGDQVPDAADFFESLRQTYTYEGKLYCLPKDYGTLALVINTEAWKQAGLTDADIPTTWDQLSTVATKLTTGGQVGLGFTGEQARVSAFMVQAGGWLVNDDSTQVTADTPENLRALEYVKTNLAKGDFAYASTLGTGWGGESLGKAKAAMTAGGPSRAAEVPVPLAAGTGGPPLPPDRPSRTVAGRRGGRSRQAGRGREQAAGWLFSLPALLTVLVFIVAPILMAAYVSMLDWNGLSSPFSGRSDFVGLDNYTGLLATSGLLRDDFMISLRNNLYYVVLSVPLVTALSFVLAVGVHQRALRARGFFRTVFYFPSITSSVAISVTFLFLFQNSGAVNTVLGWLGLRGPQWFLDSRGVLQVLLGGLGLVDAANPPGWLTTPLAGLPLWDWFAGPSVAMCALITLTVWSSSGTFMLFFLAGLQNIPEDLYEAGAIDGANSWQRFQHITLPMMRRSIVLVVTLAIIGSWQVFDQIFILSQGGPGETTLTPAFLTYQKSFGDGQYGAGAAVAFVLFAIIVFTVVQRRLGRERAL